MKCRPIAICQPLRLRQRIVSCTINVQVTRTLNFGGRTQQEVWNSLGDDFDLRPALARLEIPALVVHGDDDPIPIATAAATATALRAPLIILPECGHVPYVEAPDAFVSALDAFLPQT